VLSTTVVVNNHSRGTDMKIDVLEVLTLLNFAVLHHTMRRIISTSKTSDNFDEN